MTLASAGQLPVLVTGAGGFLGGVVAAALERDGYRVLRTGRSYRSGAIVVDLTDSGAAAALLQRGPFRAVVHFAALLPGKARPEDLIARNVAMTETIARVAADLKVEQVVYASSCSVYGFRKAPASESAEPDPPDAYAKSKLVSEQILDRALRAAGTHVASLRISAPYGENMCAATVVSQFVRAACAGEPLVVLGSGRRVQHFVHQDDVASAVRLILRQGGISGVFNLAGERAVTMQELAGLALAAAGRDSAGHVVTMGDDPQEFFHGEYPTAAAHARFGYTPVVSLPEGLARLAQRMRRQ